MPRKRRRAKKRRAGLRFEDLYLTDQFACSWGWSKPREGDLGRLKTIQQVEALWWQQRDQFMQMCTCPAPTLRTCGKHSFCYYPGKRPWGWWKFEMKMEPPRGHLPGSVYRRRYGIPRPSVWQGDAHEDVQFQYPVLEKLGVITNEERKLVQIWRDFGRRKEEEREARCSGPEESPGPEKEEVAATNLIQ